MKPSNRKLVKKSQLENILSFFFPQLPKIHHYSVNNRGKNNQVYLVDTDKAKFVIHIMNPFTNVGLERTPANFAYMFAFQDAVAEAGVPVAKRYQTKISQNYARITLGETAYYVTLHEFVKGRSFLRLNQAQIIELANSIAKIHNASRPLKLTTPPNQTWAIHSFLEQNVLNKQVETALLANTPNLTPYLLEFDAVMRAARKFLADKLHRLTKYPIHGDLNGPNLLYQQNQLVAILDFDNCHADYFCEDLSVPLLNHCTSTSSKKTKAMAWLLLDNYCRTGKLDQSELEMSLYGWLAFQAWFASTELFKATEFEEDEKNTEKLLNRAKSNLAKVRAIQQTINSGF